MILKLKSPCELFTKEGKKEFRAGSYSIEKEGIQIDHWFLSGLIQGGQAEIFEKDPAPEYKHLPDSDILKKAPEPLSLNKPFSWESVVGKEEIEEIIPAKEEIVPEKEEVKEVEEKTEQKREEPVKVEVKKKFKKK